MALRMQLSRMVYFSRLTAAPARLLSPPRWMVLQIFVRMFAATPRAMGVIIQSMANATRLVITFPSLPFTARYLPKLE